MRHRDAAVQALLRDWGLRADKQAILATFEFDSHAALNKFFEAATRHSGIRDFSTRVHNVRGQRYDLATVFPLLRRLVTEGRWEHAAAAMRYGWKEDGTASANLPAFNRTLATPPAYIHRYLDTTQTHLQGRLEADTIRRACEHAIPAEYVAAFRFGNPGWPSQGFSIEGVSALWRNDIPAEYAIRCLPEDTGAAGIQPSDIVMLYAEGVDPGYIRLTVSACGITNAIRFYEQGISAEYAALLGAP